MDTVYTPGFYPAITREEYDAIDAMNQSKLKHYLRYPRCYQDAVENPADEETDAQTFGTLMHLAFLQPGEFKDKYIVLPKSLEDGCLTGKGEVSKSPKSTAMYKQRKADFEAKHAGKKFVEASDYDTMFGMSLTIAESTTATELLAGEWGFNECCIVWDCEHTGVRCKALLDRITHFRGVNVIVDAKSTGDAGKFGHTAGQLRYPFQAAFYLWGLSRALEDGNHFPEGIERFDTAAEFVHIVCEKERPYGIRTTQFTADVLESGMKQVIRCLKTHVKCVTNNYWPAYPDDVEFVDVPPYHLI